VLITEWRSDAGAVRVTDALALEPGIRGHDLGKRSPHVLIRRVEALRGSARVETTFAPRFEYGLIVPIVRWEDDVYRASAGPTTLELRGAPDLEVEVGSAGGVFRIAEGDEIELRLAYRPTYAHEGPSNGEGPPGGAPSLDDTLAAWRSWMEPHQEYQGPFRDQVRFSALVLKGLTYERTGALLASATTSLPERIGGDANWDYRFAWLRDAGLMMRALWVAACPDEAERYFGWIAQTVSDPRHTPVVFGVEGERELAERELVHLPGHRDSRPVRVGNAAWAQKQLDVYGHVLDAACLLRERIGEFEQPVRDLLRAFADTAADRWEEPDAGMWEARDKDRQYLSSKLLCWVGLRRAVELSGALDASDEQRDRWERTADEIRARTLEEAWSEKAGAFAGALGSDEMDAAALLMPIVGFLEASDPRMLETIEVVEQVLGVNGRIRRWPGDPSGFLLCSYWLVECLVLAGQVDRAEELFRSTTAHANDLGLLTEEVDPDTGEPLGNFPQSFSHAGLVNAAWRIAEARAG